MWFDGHLGTVVATTATLDANGRGSITYGGSTFQFRVLKENVTPTPLTTNGADADLRVGLLQQDYDATLFALVLDDPPAPCRGRIVGGSNQTWYEAGSFADQDSCVFVTDWKPGKVTIRIGGVLQANVWVDMAFVYDTDQGQHLCWWESAYPWNGYGSSRGMFRTNGSGEVRRVRPDGTTEAITVPRGLGAVGYRGEQDSWPSGPEAERTLSELRVYYLGEHATISEGADTALDVAAVSLDVTGPVGAEVVLIWEGGPKRGYNTIPGGGTRTFTGLTPGKYTAIGYHPTTAGAYRLDRQDVDCPDSGGSYSVNLGSYGDYTGAGLNAYGKVYHYGSEPLVGAAVWMLRTYMPIMRWEQSATTDANGEFEVDLSVVGASATAIIDPRGAAWVASADAWWDPCVGSTFGAANSGTWYPFPATAEGLRPWGEDGAHENLPITGECAYLKSDLTGEEFTVHNASAGGEVSEPAPRYLLEIVGGAPSIRSGARITYKLYDAGGTLLVSNLTLWDDSVPPWAGSGWQYYSSEGRPLYATVGGKYHGAAVEANRSETITSALKEPFRLGLEFGKWEQPLEHRSESGALPDALLNRPITFDSWLCPYCGGPVWTDPSNGTYTRYFCMECTDNGYDTDCRAFFRTRTLSATDDNDWRDRTVKTMTSGMTVDRLIEGWPRPEEYDETASYEVADWLGLGLTRWVAIHITLGTWTNGVWTDGESIADVESRLGRTVGPVMLKLELTADYTGGGKTVEVTATDVDGAAKTLTATVLPGAEAGDRIPLDWRPHHDYRRGYYTDVTAMSATGEGALYCKVVNDGPAWHSTSGVEIERAKGQPWACDVDLSHRDPFLREDFAGRVHLVYIDDGQVMYRRLEGTSGAWSDPISISMRANWTRSCREPSIVPLPHSELVVAAHTQNATKLFRSRDDGETWE